MTDATVHHTPAIGEDATSQIPALDVLRQLGYTYLSPDEALELRGGSTAGVLLRPILEKQLNRINSIDSKAGPVPFGSDAIKNAIQRLARPDDKGLIATNETIWDLLRLGLSLQQTVDGRRRSHPMRYIDWDNPANNEFHVTEEFTVDRRGDGAIKNRRVDLVCFVNGIPFVVIECKSSTGSSSDCKPVDAAISQQLRNQSTDEIPRLFHYAQLVMGLAVNEARYAVTGTPQEHWHLWREREVPETLIESWTKERTAEEIDELRTCLEKSDYRKHDDDWAEVENYLDLCSDGRLPTEQDRLLLALCTPARLLEITRWFNLFDEGKRKVARYQQYFCVHKCLKTYEEQLPDGRRKGGIVWHTQGSGKSLTMVLLAEAVTRVFRHESPRIVIVTDRVDLDKQIKETFTKVGVEVTQANSGTQLDTLLREPRGHVITTTVHKFEDFTKKNRAGIEDDNIFVFADEGHRTQTGALHAAMRRALPKACLTGFTGTPILSGNKQTALAFGGIIDTYTIKEAVADGAVVNLVYEGRYSEQHVDSDPIDIWLAHHTFSLTDEQVQQLKSRYSSHAALNDTEKRIWRQASDISLHFKHIFKSGSTGAKAQLVTQSKSMAIRYHQALEEIGIVSSEVMISAPDTREGHSKVDDPDKPLVQQFWDDAMHKYGSEKRYQEKVIEDFKGPDGPEIIIVVDKLLTGFDAPRNSCLYLTRSLKGHTLLQAIARVNRVYKGKEYGLIVDYYGVVKELEGAIDLYSTFDGTIDQDDIQDVLQDMSHAIADLPDLHNALWNCFKGLPPNDQEAHEQALAEKDDREVFYEALSQFARKFNLARASEHFYANVDSERIEIYKRDLKYFLKLRKSVAIRYAETVDFGQYEASIKKLLDEYVGADDVQTVVVPVLIFDETQLAKDVSEFTSPDAKAEVIANRIQRTIDVKMNEDPAFYKSLGKLLEAARDEYHKLRTGELFLEAVTELMENAQARKNAPVQQAYRDLAKDMIEPAAASSDSLDEISQLIESTIDNLAIIDWQRDTDVQNRMKIEIEDAIIPWLKQHDITPDFDEIDGFLDDCINAARTRSER